MTARSSGRCPSSPAVLAVVAAAAASRPVRSGRSAAVDRGRRPRRRRRRHGVRPATSSAVRHGGGRPAAGRRALGVHAHRRRRRRPDRHLGRPARTTTGRTGRRSTALMCLFLGAMSLAVLADNLGVLWVAVEATTIATAFLVGHRGSRRGARGGLEVRRPRLGRRRDRLPRHRAALRRDPAAGTPTLSWATLSTSDAAALDPALARVAARARGARASRPRPGLAPMHSWLPDAHSQAPAPVSGLMSGVLLSVAFYAHPAGPGDQ